MSKKNDGYVLNRIGVLMREKRAKEKLSQKSLGEIIGVCRSQVAMVELQYSSPSFTTLLKIMRWLDVDAHRLLRGIK